MKKLLFSLFVFISFILFSPQAYAAFSFYRTVTVTSSVANASGTQSDFPVLFNVTANWLETTSSDAVNGRIQQFSGSDQKPRDIVFTTSTPAASGSKWTCPAAAGEIESYSSSTGALQMWFRATTMQASQVYYVCYGDTSITTTQEASSSVWDANYKGVWHWRNSGGVLSKTDSTQRAGDFTTNSINPSNGEIDGSANSQGGNSQTGNFSLGTTALTISLWMNASDTNNGTLFEKVPVNAAWELLQNGTLIFRGGNTNNQITVTQPSLNAWHYVVGTITGTSGVLYVDGVATAGTIDAVVDQSSALWSFALDVGGFQTIGSHDEMRVSNTARSSLWEFTEYNNQSRSDFLSLGAETAGSSGVTAKPLLLIRAGSGTGNKPVFLIRQGAGSGSGGLVSKTNTATGHSCNNNGCSGADLSATISSGVTCALVGINFRNNVSNVTVTWASSTANQAFTEVGTGIFNGAASHIYKLINPSAAVSGITASWTTASDAVWTFATFSNSDTSTCVDTAQSLVTNSGASGNPSVTVTATANDATFGIGGQGSNNWTSTVGGTQITLDNVTFVNGAGSYFDPTHSVGASNKHEWNTSTGAWSAAGVRVKAPSGASKALFTIRGT